MTGPTLVVDKLLGRKSYGSIPHLPGSKRGYTDYGLNDGQARICTEKRRDLNDLIIVQEKLDGSNVCVANINGEIVALGRAGYLARTSPYQMHRMFDSWVKKNEGRFKSLLSEGERCIGEWLIQAHGTLYRLPHEPFVVFDIMTKDVRLPYLEFISRVVKQEFVFPRLIHFGDSISIKSICSLLEPSGHGAIDPVEGAIWRVERKYTVDFLAKYVRPEKVNGIYLPEISGGSPVWNKFNDDSALDLIKNG